MENKENNLLQGTKRKYSEINLPENNVIEENLTQSLNKANEENILLNKINNDLSNENDLLDQENREVNEENDQIRREKRDLGYRLETLIEKYKNLAKFSLWTMKKNNLFDQTIEDLCQENDILSQEITESEEEKQELREANRELSQNNAELRLEIKALKKFKKEASNYIAEDEQVVTENSARMLDISAASTRKQKLFSKSEVEK